MDNSNLVHKDVKKKLLVVAILSSIFFFISGLTYFNTESGTAITYNTSAREADREFLCKDIIDKVEFDPTDLTCKVTSFSEQDIVCGIKDSETGWPVNCMWDGEAPAETEKHDGGYTISYDCKYSGKKDEEGEFIPNTEIINSYNNNKEVFVGGLYNKNLEDVQPVVRCVDQWNTQAKWTSITRSGGKEISPDSFQYPKIDLSQLPPAPAAIKERLMFQGNITSDLKGNYDYIAKLYFLNGPNWVRIAQQKTGPGNKFIFNYDHTSNDKNPNDAFVSPQELSNEHRGLVAYRVMAVAVNKSTNRVVAARDLKYKFPINNVYENTKSSGELQIHLVSSDRDPAMLNEKDNTDTTFQGTVACKGKPYIFDVQSEGKNIVSTRYIEDKYTCITPRMIVLHWNEVGNFSGNGTTYAGLSEIQENGDNKGNCGFAVDHNGVLQMNHFYDSVVEQDGCQRRFYNNYAISFEINGSDFDLWIDNEGHIVNPKDNKDLKPGEVEAAMAAFKERTGLNKDLDWYDPKYTKIMEQEINHTILTLRSVMQKYNLKKEHIFTHYQISPKKKDSGDGFYNYILAHLDTVDEGGSAVSGNPQLCRKAGDECNEEYDSLIPDPDNPKEMVPGHCVKHGICKEPGDGTKCSFTKNSRGSSECKRINPSQPKKVQAPQSIPTKSYDELRQEITSGNTNEKRVIFTFDAGGANLSTDAVLTAFENHNVYTTFFVTGAWADKNPDALKSIAAAGHTIHNHTRDHQSLYKVLKNLGEEEVKKEFTDAEDTISKYLSNSTTKPYFRAPFGDFGNSVSKEEERKYKQKLLDIAAKVGYQHINWGVDVLDWYGAPDAGKKFNDMASPKLSKDKIYNNLNNGTIFLMHVNDYITGDIMDEVLTEVIDKRGFKVVTLEEGLK